LNAARNNLNATFPIFEKIEVNGEEAHPLYKHLKTILPHKIYNNGTVDEDVKWNFEKFLIDQNGVPVKRYNFSINPFDIEDDILELLDLEYESDVDEIDEEGDEIDKEIDEDIDER
jgi:glutathione peroxidase